MAALATPEWLDAVVTAGAALAATPGLDLALQFEVAASASSRSKKNVTRFWIELVDGRPVSAGDGKHADPRCTLSCSVGDGVALLTGELDADVAFMQGRFKIDGAYEELVFDRREVFGRSDHLEFRASVAGFTEAPAT